MYSIFLIHRTTSYDNKELKNIYAKEIENKDETNEELLRVEQIRRKTRRNSGLKVEKRNRW